MLLLLPPRHAFVSVLVVRVTVELKFLLRSSAVLPVPQGCLPAVSKGRGLRSLSATTRGVRAAVALPTADDSRFPVLGRCAVFTASWLWRMNLVRAIVGWIKATILLLPLLSLLLPLRAEARGLLLPLGASVPVPFLSTSLRWPSASSLRALR